jgi:hypothetical protein
MKRLSISFAAILIASLCFAQSPESFKYQAVVRNIDGSIVDDQSVSFQMEILVGSATGTAIYTETHTTTTNDYGLVHLDIGEGTSTDDFSSIDWGDDEYFLQVSIDLTGGTTYTILGASQLLSVPYALHAKTAAYLTGSITELDPLYSASEAANILAVDITNLGNLSGTNTGDQDLSTLATRSALTDSTLAVRSALSDSTLAVRSALTDSTLAVRSALTDSTLAVRSALADSAQDIRADIPDAEDGAEVNVQSDWTEVSTASDAYIANKPALSTVALSGDYGDLNNLPVTDGSETNIEGGDGIGVSGTGVTADPYVIALGVSDAHHVGELYGGGVVFYTWANGQHGLIASLGTLSASSNWDAAVAACAAHGDGGNDDWYLPGVEEAKVLFNSSFIINRILNNDGNPASTELANDMHWTSTEIPVATAYIIHYTLFDISGFIPTAKGGTYQVRAVREF